MNAIVLTSTRYNDDGYMVNLFTEDSGYVTVSVKTGKKSRVRACHLQPLNVLSVVLSGRPSQRVMKIEECTTLAGYDKLMENPIKILMAQFLAEFLQHALRSYQSDRMLFGFLTESLKQYGSMKRGTADFHLVFLVKLTYYLGFFPNLEGFDKDVYFDLIDGRFVKYIPLHSHYLSPSQTLGFAQLLRADYDTVYLYGFTRAERNEVLDYIISYYKLHTPDFGELRSLDVLRNL